MESLEVIAFNAVGGLAAYWLICAWRRSGFDKVRVLITAAAMLVYFTGDEKANRGPDGAAQKAVEPIEAGEKWNQERGGFADKVRNMSWDDGGLAV